MACGTNFAILLSTQGLVFSFGKAAESGQLGHGDTKERLLPELIQTLKDCGERIQAIACGHAHCVVKSVLGKVYTWGHGGYGQLGHGTLDYELSPKLVGMQTDTEMCKKKAVNIAAGYSHTVILIEGRIPYYFGTCGDLIQKCEPIEMPLKKRYPELFPKGANTTAFTIAKIAVTWSRASSITFATVLDMRPVATAANTKATVEGKSQVSGNMLNQHLNTLSTKWNQKDIEPPYIEGLAGIFSANVMHKPVPAGKKKGAPKTPNSAAMIRGSLKKGIKSHYEGREKEKGLEGMVKDIEKKLLEILDKDPEQRTDAENSMISVIANKIFK